MSFATIVERGCGERKAGGLYVECGLGPDGKPIEYFLVDSPLPLPAGLGERELINKPQLWCDDRTGLYHLVIWVGREHYPHAWDYITEVSQYGASRRLPKRLAPMLKRLTPGRSRMIMIHPEARLEDWMRHTPPALCGKECPGHAELMTVEAELPRGTVTVLTGTELTVSRPAAGPCLWTAKHLIPARDGECMGEGEDGRPVYIRTHAQVSYSYEPSDEDRSGLKPGIFAALPISGFAAIRHSDGTIDEDLEEHLTESGFRYYTSDK
jgi:hypothetical protein